MPNAPESLPQVILPTFDVGLADIARQRLDASRLLVIHNDTDYELVAARLKDAKARLEVLDSGYEKHASPLNRAIKAVREFWNPTREIVKEECGLLARMLGAYHEAKLAKQRELQRQADERAAKERRALEQRAQKAEERGDADKAAALVHQAATTVAPVIRTDAPKIAGQSVREVWLFQIEDASQIPREYLVPDEQKIRRFVNALKADARIPGVRIYSEKRVASGA